MNSAEYAIAPKTLKTPEKALEFLSALIAKIKPWAKKDLRFIENKARDLGLPDLEPWDIAYLAECLTKEKFSCNEEEMRAYFPLHKALTGLFEVLYRLFKVTFQEKMGVDTWDPEVKCYELYDEQHRLRGTVFADFFSRDNKSRGSWNDSLRHRKLFANGTVQNPVSVLVCNFTKIGETAYLTPTELREELFHEFGHCMQLLLTEAELPSLSALESIPWDAIEIPSIFLENWSKDAHVLQSISEHQSTHLPLSFSVINQLTNSNKFLNSLGIMRYLIKALFDLRIHIEFNPACSSQINNLIHELNTTLLLAVPHYYRMANQNKHSFAGEYDDAYASSYWTYALCDVLTADAFTRFKADRYDKNAAEDFKHFILEPGGLNDPMASFNQFMQRPLDASFNMIPYLEAQGLLARTPLQLHSRWAKITLEKIPEVNNQQLGF